MKPHRHGLKLYLPCLVVAILVAGWTRFTPDQIGKLQPATLTWLVLAP
jgi:hypothetical protein